MSKALSKKRQRFIQEYLVDLNGTQAAIRSGYSPKTASKQAWQLLENSRIQEAIQEAQQRRSTRIELDQDYVVNGLVENFERAMQTRPALDRSGKPTGEYTYQGNVANKALELIGKHLGMFVEKRQIEGNLNVSRTDLPDEELVGRAVAIIEKLNAGADGQ